MKTRVVYEHEHQYHGTPAAFLAYLRRQAKNHPGEYNDDFDLRLFRTGGGMNSSYSDALPGERPCMGEVCKGLPYESQAYITYWDGTTYNEIIEFRFDNETDGIGYYYTIQREPIPGAEQENTSENVAGIIRRRMEKAERLAKQAERIRADLAPIESRPEWYVAGAAERVRADLARVESERTELLRSIESFAVETAAETVPETAPETAAETVPETAAETTAETVPETAAETTAETAATAGPVPMSERARTMHGVALFEKMRAELLRAMEDVRAGRLADPFFSAGNSKTHIPSIDLLPVFTCPGRCHGMCARVVNGRKVPDCYACKGNNIRPDTIRHRADNTALAILRPDLYWAAVDRLARVSRFIRYFVAGDMIIKGYFANMVETARNNPHCTFLAYTKAWEIVNRWIDQNGPIPENLVLILSGWINTRPDNPHNLPETTVYTRPEEFRPEWLSCGGNCLECACRGLGCWRARSGDVVAFKKH